MVLKSTSCAHQGIKDMMDNLSAPPMTVGQDPGAASGPAAAAGGTGSREHQRLATSRRDTPNAFSVRGKISEMSLKGFIGGAAGLLK